MQEQWESTHIIWQLSNSHPRPNQFLPYEFQTLLLKPNLSMLTSQVTNQITKQVGAELEMCLAKFPGDNATFSENPFHTPLICCM